jgi:cyclopropane fatty-acyl-phospholipid synthase-like methyltransferase
MPQLPGEDGRSRDTTSGYALAPYYSSGRLLQEKHAATSSAARDFPDWVHDRLSLDGVDTALDAGCGWGRFSVRLLHRPLADSCRLVCSDLYRRMVTRARSVLSAEGLTASYVAADIAVLPFRDDRFDRVMANMCSTTWRTCRMRCGNSPG